ncbi:5-oxoprolinase subunit PxpA [Flavobacterium sp. RSSA_27]|uniref:5-oxoprolinase subunit PxpA n=1 Tax=Flavobacterium sp. RSSA_27 TaxID=3447667 RepID=UPI003F3E502E
MKIFSIDLNCDMGEGMPNDEAIMPFISSANIACGYHAGNTIIMQETVVLAIKNNVKIGAHPSFPDRVNFGRTIMHFSSQEIANMVQEQIESLLEVTKKNHAVLHHVKPHGALYNQAFKDEAVAEGICQAILSVDTNLILYAQSGSVLYRKAQEKQLRVCAEVFADRTYQTDGSLTPRSEREALLHTTAAVQSQVVQMALQQKVLAKGTLIPIQADTICVHGDGEHALDFVKMIRKTLLQNGIQIHSIHD